MEEKEGLTLVYFGTPGFAVAPLKAIVEEGVRKVLAVVTAPDKPAGRGYKLRKSEVKEYAELVGIPVLQPEKLKAQDFLEELKALHADVFVIVAFRMLPVEVWNMPPHGTFNLHASLLPDYRGAAPINWAIINGEEKTGVTTFFLRHEIDTGDIIAQRSQEITTDMNVGELHDKLMAIGASLVLGTLDMIAANSCPRVQQDTLLAGRKPKEAPKLNKDNTRISWQASAETIHNLIRGLSPYPSAWTMMHTDEGPKQLRIFQSRLYYGDVQLSSGQCKVHDKKLLCGTQDGIIEILQLQREGKNKMDAAGFINGLRSDGFLVE